MPKFTKPKRHRRSQNRDFEAFFSHFCPQTRQAEGMDVKNGLSNHFQKKEMPKTLNYRTAPFRPLFHTRADSVHAEDFEGEYS